MSQRSSTDLCGGCRATGIPTGTLFSRGRTCTTGCYGAPEEMKLQVHKQVIETLAKLNPGESRRVTRQLVEAATEKVLKSWRKQKGNPKGH